MPDSPQPIISSKYALDGEEMMFATKVAAGLPVATSFRRIWPELCVDKTGKPLGSKEVHRKADSRIKEAHIKGFLKELEKSPADVARTTVQETMLLGDPVGARAAAKMVLEDADLMGAMSEYERFWHLACACGAVAVTTVGGVKVTVPLSELMPKFKDAVPPQEVQRKTAESLKEWYTKLQDQAEDLDARERSLD